MTSIAFIISAIVWLFYSYSVDLQQFATDVKIVAGEAIENKAISNVFVHMVLITFSITGVLLGGSAYSAQQSTKHRNNEKRARWFAIETTAFDPFINSLPEDQQQELKRKLVGKLFGQSTDIDKRDDVKISDEHILKGVTDIAEKVTDKIIEKLSPKSKKT